MASDWEAIEALLRQCRLPLDGAREHLEDFLLALDGSALVATAAIEAYVPAALLRSMAVAESHRGRGIGEALLRRVIQEARRRDVRALYLLTTTARDYFSRRGFVLASRGEAPSALQTSAEFKGACPASATLMSMAVPSGALPMQIRAARPDDADAIQAIYAPVVRDTAISFELEPPTVEEMRARIVSTTRQLPWLVGIDGAGAVIGYVYAGKHRERAAYQWSVDVTAYVHSEHRGRGVGKALYLRLFEQLTKAGYCQAFAGIALPNAGSIALHESVGFAAIGIYRNVGFKHGAWHDVGWWQRELQLPQAPRRPDAAPSA